MKRKTVIAKIFMPLVLAVYLFSALFSQHFHNHGSGEVFKEFHFKNSKSAFSKVSAANSADCFSCYLMHESHSAAPDFFSFKFLENPVFLEKYSDFQFVYLYKKAELSTLRGPPQI